MINEFNDKDQDIKKMENNNDIFTPCQNDFIPFLHRQSSITVNT